MCALAGFLSPTPDPGAAVEEVVGAGHVMGDVAMAQFDEMTYGEAGAELLVDRDEMEGRCSLARPRP